ncbi:type II toxin-antitoxin system VapC family toxin [Candidatus Collierbacteria bacterium]|nr:type II toxin-antitoxin system VapC family toxin [Candidatus Collierbacteria bacterium]
MKKVLVDTDILIDFFRSGRGSFPALIGLQKQRQIELYLSSITVMELFAGKSSAETAVTLEKFIDSFKVVTFDKVLARFSGELRRERKLAIQTSDFIIGATSIWLKVQLATRNKKHFQGIPGLKFFNA